MTELTSKQLRKAAKIKDKIESLQSELGKLLGNSDTPVQADAPKKRKMSAAGRARISAAAKARWAKIKRDKKKA